MQFRASSDSRNKMVLGLKTRNMKNPYIQLEYIINLIEIKPWPPSQSLRSLRSALIQWEHGDKNSGSTKAVAPSVVSGLGVGDGKIVFNESFKVHVTLFRDPSIKTGDDETFLRNCIEFNMYEPRRDRTVKGQLLATATIDFAEYGVVEGSLMVSVPMTCKRTFGNTAQPMLFVKIQTIEKNNPVRSSSGLRLTREGSMDSNRSESVSALMNEEYAEEAETASITDDDIFSQSSMAASSPFGSNGISTPPKENGYEAICGTSDKVNDKKVSVQGKRAAYEKHILSSKDLYTEVENARTTLANIRNSRFTMLPRKAIASDGISEESCIQFKILDASQSGQERQTVDDFGFNADRLKNVKSFGSSSDSCLSNGSVRTSKVIEKFKNVGVHDQNNGRIDIISKVQHLEQRVQVLEGELTEAAAIEFSIYSVVAEHGSSIRKVHAPARRLSRLYFHACEDNSLRRLNSAKSIVSGLILVAKACGNDVARLTFWLSNSVVLRAIIHNNIEKDSCSNVSRSGLHADSNEWDDTRVITSDLEKVESWIFSRIVESIWWQTLAPYMHSTAAERIIRDTDGDSSKSCQTTTSLELWKMAFHDVCERICPVRAAGHTCGCLSVLSMLIMEKCMGRLDVAMFNAILRELGDELPTDPVSDPISDSWVLPIPSGKASVGAGALLKRTVGNWSSWLTDLFGSPITFHLLTALSELMMLPKDMLLSNTIRKEVCPTFGIPLIKRILDNFTPDEFCPDPLPEVVLEALDSEDLSESSEDCIMSLPCAAAPIVYHPPSASLIGCILGDDGGPARLSRTGSSIIGKSNTSDDELDELDSPLTSLVDSSRAVAASVKPMWSLKNDDRCNNNRYRLLREAWMNSE